MLNRIAACLIGTVLCLAALVYLSATAAPDGSSEISYTALYSDIALSVCVYMVLLFVFVLPLVYVRVIARRGMQPDSCVAVVAFNGEDAWQKPTSVGHLEALKQEHRAIQERVHYLRLSEDQVRKRSRENASGLELWLGERGLSILRNRCRKEASRAYALRQDIDRIYEGDVDREILDYREEIAQLVAQRETGNPESFTAQCVNPGIDRKIRLAERNIVELEQWRKKVTAAKNIQPAPPATESPCEAAWRTFLDTVKRSAAAPLAEATSHMEAAFAGVEAKRYYERKVDELLRRSAITRDEADYIQERINEEFLGNRTSIFA